MSPSLVNIVDLLHRIRGFVSDLYVIFAEFTTAITNIVQGKDLYIDTEELSTQQTSEKANVNRQGIESIAPLKRVYETHVQLNEQKGLVASRVSDVTAFLIFLEGRLDSNLLKREEIITQLHNTAKLLNDLSYLLADYEQAVSLLLQQE